MNSRWLASTFVVVLFAACGSSDDSDDQPPARQPAEQVTQSAKPTPMGCLEEAGLTKVERRDKNLWRGINPGGNIVAVDRMPSKADARQAQRQADLVVSEAVGRWFIHGPLRDADDGSTAAVADCLRGG